MTFTTSDFIALGALLVALVGGIPGIIAMVNQARNHPIFQFTVEAWISGTDLTSSSGKPESVLILVLTLVNRGTVPLVPSHFEARIKVKNRFRPLQKRLVPSKLTFDADIQMPNPADVDLQRFSGSISSITPARGCLMFASETLSQNELKPEGTITLELTCIDIFGKRHTSVFNHTSHEIDTSMEFPQHGLLVIKRTEGRTKP